MKPLPIAAMLRCGSFWICGTPETSGGTRRRKFLPTEAPAVTPPPVGASCDERAVAQPRTATAISVVDGGADEEGAANEHTSVEPVNEERSVEPVNENRAVEMTYKCMAWSEAEVAKAKTTEAPETTNAEVPETTTAMTTKAHGRCCS